MGKYIFLIYCYLIFAVQAQAGKGDPTQSDEETDQDDICLEHSSAPLTSENTEILKLIKEVQQCESKNKGIQIPLIDLICRAVDLNSKKDISEIHELQQILQSAPSPSLLRTQTYERDLEVLGKYQFSDQLAFRELVANGFDSYYHDSSLSQSSLDKKKVMVRTDREGGVVEIQDEGIGMSLGDIVYYLLTPGRSKNNVILDPNSEVEGVTGRFGQGFFSVLSFLKENQDSVTIQTRSKTGRAIDVVLRKQDSKYRVEIQEGGRKSPGTTIRVQSKELLKPYKDSTLISHLEKEVFIPYFQYSYRGELTVDGRLIKPTDSIKHSSEIYSKLDPKKKATLLESETKESLGSSQGRLVITVNGVKITEYKLNGPRIYKNTVVIDLPPDFLTVDRGVLDFKNPMAKDLFNQIVSKAIHEGDLLLLNNLTPLIGREGFDLLDEILQLKSKLTIIPGQQNLSDLTQLYRGKIGEAGIPEPVRLLDSKLYDSSSLLDQFPSIIDSRCRETRHVKNDFSGEFS